MKIRRPLALFIVLSISLTPILSSFSISSAANGGSSNPVSSSIPESHLVEGVPYVGQETGFYCYYASVTMILQYYGINTTLKEVLHHSGVGYSLYYNDLYNRDKLVSSFFRIPIPGYAICQSISNTIDLASLFNLTFNYWFPNQNTCSIESSWGDYWSRVKENVTNNIPVMTGVNVEYFPYTNVSSGHTVVIVGFNQTHVFYNDPATAVLSKPEDGFYANMSIDIFQKAVNSTPATRFIIGTFENNSNVYYNKTKIFEKAHERNIKRLEGFFTEDLQYINTSINAVKSLRNDFRVGPLHRMLTVRRYWDYCKQNGPLYDSFYLISIECHNVSQYLLENKELSPKICAYDGMLLENVSKHWMNIFLYTVEFEKIALKYGYWVTSIKSLPITGKIKSELNKIISIENSIIRGPSDTAY